MSVKRKGKRDIMIIKREKYGEEGQQVQKNKLNRIKVQVKGREAVAFVQRGAKTHNVNNLYKTSICNFI